MSDLIERLRTIVFAPIEMDAINCCKEAAAEIESLNEEINKLKGWLSKAPHEPDCASLTPRPMSISAYFDYKPPNCNCYKDRFLYEQEQEARTDHEFSYQSTSRHE